MKTKFKIIGIANDIAKLQRVGVSGFLAYADSAKYIGNVGDTVELADREYVPEGCLAQYQAMSDRYDAEAAK